MHVKNGDKRALVVILQCNNLSSRIELQRGLGPRSEAASPRARSRDEPATAATVGPVRTACVPPPTDLPPTPGSAVAGCVCLRFRRSPATGQDDITSS